MEIRPPYNHDIDQNSTYNLFDILRPDQLNQLAQYLREVIGENHGEVTMVVKDGKVRFIKKMVSKSFGVNNE